MDHFLGRNDEQMRCRGILHIVEAGDTLYRIGKKYGVPVSRIMYANPYVNVYNLQIGDEICVPVMIPRMPMGENDMPRQRHQGQMMPVREDRTGEQKMHGNRRGEHTVPVRRDYMEDSRVPSGENPMPGIMMPACGNSMEESAACRNRMEESGMPAQKRYMQRHTVPAADSRRNAMRGDAAHGNRMGFPLAPLEEAIVDVETETENDTYRRNRMVSVEKSAGSGMREAPPKPEEDQSMRNQPDTDSDRREASKNPPESAETDNPGRGYMPGTGGCTEKESCLGIRNSKAMPWDDTGVSEQMMHEYLQEAPGYTSESPERQHTI